MPADRVDMFGERLSSGMALFLVAAICVVSYFWLDRPLAEAMTAVTPVLHAAAGVVSAVGDPRIWYGLAGAGIPLWWWLQRIGDDRARDVLFVALALLTTWLVVAALKYLTGRPRPPMFLDHGLYGFLFAGGTAEFRSFPSGHSACAFALAVTLGRYSRPARHVLFAVAGLIALSRLVLGIHYLGDVVAGAYLGVMIPVLVSRLAIFSRVPAVTERSPPGPATSGRGAK